MSAAEKQRKYRARRDADPARRAAYLEKQRQAWHRLRAQRKVKTVGMMSEREKRSKRAYWRKAQKESRERKTKLQYRDVSCPCTTRQSFECRCDGTHDFAFDVEHTATLVPQTHKAAACEIPWGPDLIGEWCVVRYEGDIYPGIIQDIMETHVQVKCMSNIGVNRFFWPLREDVLWYLFEDVLRMIPPPKAVNSRHVEIDREIWSSL